MRTTLFIILYGLFFHHQISFSKPVLGEITNTDAARETTNPNENQKSKSYVDSSTQTRYFLDPRISPEKLNTDNAPNKDIHNTVNRENIPINVTSGKYLRLKGLLRYTTSLALALTSPSRKDNNSENDLINDQLTETDPSSDSLDGETDNSENIMVISGHLSDCNEKPSRTIRKIHYKCNKEGCQKSWLTVGESQPECILENAIPSGNRFTNVTPRSKNRQEARISRIHPYVTPRTKLRSEAMKKRLESFKE